MMCFNYAEDVLYEFPQIERGRATFSEGYIWVRHRPVAVVQIDLDQDDCQAIARKLDLWERIARHSTI